jgi:hypothetical protein
LKQYNTKGQARQKGKKTSSIPSSCNQPNKQNNKTRIKQKNKKKEEKNLHTCNF